MQAGISFSELLGWIGEETTKYETWFAGQPAGAWTAPAGSGRTATVRDLLFHTYVVDLRYGQRLHSMPVSSYEDEAVAEPMAMFPLARRGQALLRQAAEDGRDLGEVIEFQTLTAGTLRASRRKVLAHSITHHLRHTAQIATLLRQAGHPTGWMHDLLMSGALA